MTIEVKRGMVVVSNHPTQAQFIYDADTQRVTIKAFGENDWVSPSVELDANLEDLVRCLKTAATTENNHLYRKR